MFEKVSKFHPDKVADRIAGALVDLAYKKQENPKIAVEVLLGHGDCHIISETSCTFYPNEVTEIVHRIAGEKIKVDYAEVGQDIYLARNQEKEFRCGDNGIFRGVPVSNEQVSLIKLAEDFDKKYASDGKYIVDKGDVIICQSNAKTSAIQRFTKRYGQSIRVKKINPLGDWTGGTDVDCGATNRKLGSDMGDSVTGGGLHGKDLSKADVAINIYCWLQAQETKRTITASCAIGDTTVMIDGRFIKYKDIVEIAKNYIQKIGGFEKFAEYGLLR